MVQFKKNSPRGLSKRKTFNKNDSLSKKWDVIIKDGSLEKAYRNSKISGVMKVTGLKKTSAYILVGRAGLLRKKLEEKKEEIENKILETRLSHCKKHYEWVPRQEYCRLKGKIYSFKKPYKLGKYHLMGGRQYFIASIPAKSVFMFMVQRGLKFLIINHKIELVEKFEGRKHAIVIIQKD